MRVLATSTGNAGHFAPLVPVLRAVRESGGEVLVVVPPGLVSLAEEAGFTVRPGAEPPPDEIAAIWDRVPVVSRDEAAILVNREIFGRLDTEAMRPVVEQTYDEWRPDVVVHEPAEFAGAVVAERRGIPHVQVAIGLAGVEAASIEIAAPVLHRWGAGFVDGLLQAPYLTRFPESLDPSPFARTLRFREPADRDPAPLPDWWSAELSAEPLVYVSFGTVAGRLPIGERLYPAAGEAMADLPARVLLTTGRTRDPAALGQPAANVHVESWVDQASALAEASVVVCHGGAGTTFGALAAGRPLVVVPLMADQPTNGRIAAGAGAGVVVAPNDSAVGGIDTLATRLRSAVEEVLATPSYRFAAERIAREMESTPVLGDVLDDLLGG